MIATISGWVVGLIGLVLAVGGIWLAVLGGSGYYLFAALGFLATAGLLIKRRVAALWIYAAVLLGTLIWALWEVGLDWWSLAPRCGVIALIGVWLLTPWVTRNLGSSRARQGGASWRSAGLPLAVSLAIAAVVALMTLFTDPYDIEGQLPAPQANQPPLQDNVPAGDWPAYGRTGFGQRYSPLDEITPENVDRLEVAWTYHTGDIRGEGDPTETTYEVTPLKVDDTLYLCTPHNLAIALDADTGEERWRFDPEVAKNINRQHQTCRGVSYYDSTARNTAASGGSARDTATGAPTQIVPQCARRLYLPTADARLIALDAETGTVCQGFGDDGVVNLWANMPNLTPGFYYSTSPPVVTQDLIIVGGAVNDNVSTTEPSGVVRAYDVDTGALVWNWDSGNPTATTPIAADQTYTPNSPNMWSIASVDEELGLVYLPLGNAVPDQWGAERSQAMERFSSSIVALDVATGKVRWVFQTVHHDLWDMDVPAQPSLIDLHTDTSTVPALVAPTKQGDVYVLDRETGEPVLPVEEVQAPLGAVSRDVASPTQPLSALTFNPPPLTEHDMWGATMFDQLACRIKFRSLRYQGRYTPPSQRGTLVYPGNFGVFNWGGLAVDPQRQVAFTTPAYLAFISTLVPREDATTSYVSDGVPGIGENYGAPFAVKFSPFMSPVGLPCQAPPWGYVAGADLRTGEIAWRHRNGTVRDLAPLPLPFEMGVPDLGGPVMTAGGVAFISGTLDYYVRAYDVTTGEQLWEDRLPAGGQATPMTYRASNGKQMVLVVAGGHGSLGTRAGDAIIAYHLPD
ncbi:glucose/quinate/shikimate family membrane-bound PQQ-dependent dehydrogenase [Halomonas sp. WWR20]